MDRLKQMFEREFQKMDGLFQPADKLKVGHKRSYSSYEYRSAKYSNPHGCDDCDNSTRIHFSVFDPEIFNGVSASISFLSVHHKKRRRGFGSKMVQAAENTLRANGLKKISLNDFQEEAKEFWEKVGYVYTIRDGRDYGHYMKELE